jgi:phosphorylcholine metabolism protein LicD
MNEINEIEIDENDINYKKYILSQPFINEIYLILKNFSELCEKNNINYWVDGGTLLGCVREQGQILHDNDADVGMLPEDYDKFIKLTTHLEETYKYTINNHADGFLKILSYNVCLKNVTKDEIIVPCLDIFVYEKFRNMIVIKNRDIRHSFPKAWHFEKDLFPLCNMKYSDIELKGPNNPYPYLDRYYGKWKIKKVYEKPLCFIK